MAETWINPNDPAQAAAASYASPGPNAAEVYGAAQMNRLLHPEPDATAGGGPGTGAGTGGATSGTGLFGGGPGGLTQLSDLINSINRLAQQQANAGRIPNAAGLEGTSSGVIGQELAGEVPADVQALLGQRAAERGVSTGNVGGPGTNAAYLRALGLTSLGQIQQGEQNLTSALGRNPAAPLFNPATQLLTPYQTAQITSGGAGGGGGVVSGGGGGGSGGVTIPTGPAGGGGYTITGGGGGLPPFDITHPNYSSAPAVGQSPSWDTLFGSGTPAIPGGSTEINSGYTTDPYQSGYQPTSSGTMYTGPAEGYLGPNLAPEYPDTSQGGMPTDVVDYGSDYVDERSMMAKPGTVSKPPVGHPADLPLSIDPLTGLRYPSYTEQGLPIPVGYM